MENIRNSKYLSMAARQRRSLEFMENIRSIIYINSAIVC